MSEHLALRDEAARRAIATELERTLCVKAGAGSGKTRHLVQRVCNLLVSGRASVEQIAVITFTEAAAAELRTRLAEALELVAREPTAHGTLRCARAEAALAGLDGAAVGTLHGFARRILAEHPFAAGLPARFEVLDEASSVEDLDERFRGALDLLAADVQGARALAWCALVGISLSALRAIYRQLGGSWDRVADSVDDVSLATLDLAQVIDPLEHALALESACTDEGDLLLVHLQRLEPYRDQLRRASEEDDELTQLDVLVDDAPRLANARAGKASAWSGRKPDVVGFLDEAARASADLVSAASGSALSVVGAILGRHAVAEARRRVVAGRLEYHDLLVVARDLVRDDPEVRRALHRRYTHLFVDEMQDTDPLQVDLVTMIAAVPEAEVHLAPRGGIPTVPGATFFVGDPMQSIYAFRGADVRAFEDVIEQVATEDVSLTTNFRSTGGIVDWVNGVFETLVGDGEPGLQPEYQRAHHVREDEGAAPVPVTVLEATQKNGGTAESVRQREAHAVAVAIRAMVDGQVPVGRDGRPVRYDDVAVLVPTRASIRALEAAFITQEIDYRLEKSSYVYSAQEVRDLLCVLRAVDDPLDELSVLAALRSSGFACGDDDLLRYRLAGGSWDYRDAAPPGCSDRDPVVQALGRLRELSSERLFVPVSELVARVVDELRLFETALDTERWQEEWRRLRFVVDQARQFSEGSPGGLHEYLQWVAVQSEEGARVTEVVLPEAGTPAVTVMTVHGAKGLEFPVVAVVGFGGSPQGVRGPAVLFADGRLEIGVRRDRCTPGFEAAAEVANAREAHERLRLFYVAVTRAMNHLIVSVDHPSSKKQGTESIAARVKGAIRELGPLWASPHSDDSAPVDREDRRARVGAGATTQSEALGESGESGESEASFEEWEAARRRRFAEPPRVVAATGVAKLLALLGPAALDGGPHDREDADPGDPDPQDADPFGIEVNRRKGRGGTALGRAVHAVLQAGDLAGGEDLAVLAREHARAEGIPSEEREVLRVAQAAASSAIVRRAVSGRYWRELYVGARVGERVLEGFVDLLFEGPDGLEVVDYKTDRVRDDAEIAALVDRYQIQAASYALGVEEATGRRVAHATLLFVRPEVPVAREVLGLAEIVAQVRQKLGNASELP